MTRKRWIRIRGEPRKLHEAAADDGTGGEHGNQERRGEKDERRARWTRPARNGEPTEECIRECGSGSLARSMRRRMLRSCWSSCIGRASKGASERDSRANEQRLGRLLAAADGGGNVAYGQVVEIVEKEHQALVGGQGGEGHVDGVALLVVIPLQIGARAVHVDQLVMPAYVAPVAA
jgi:hypothetical protein